MITKPPLFFIHGMWSTPSVWSWFADRYRDRGYEVVTPTLPFHDKAPDEAPDPLLATTSVTDYVDALLADVRALGQAPVIVGHSMGGLLAQLVAGKAEAAGLVLLSPGPTAQATSLTWNSARTLLGVTTKANWWRSPTRIDEQRARWGIFNGVPEEDVRAALAELVWDSGRALFQMAMPFAASGKPTQADYDRLTMPALVLVGEEDRTTPIRIARATARNLRGEIDYVELPGVGHWIFHEPVRQRVAEEIDQLLKRVEG